MKIVFFGSSKFVIPIIEVLQKNFNLALVLTTEENPTDQIPSYCIKNKIPYFSTQQQFNNSTIQQLQKINASIGVLADFGLIIPSEILNYFPKGIINIHPSFLPKYRGPTPVQTSILNGEKNTGVSIIKLDEEIDHGPILAQTQEPILDNDTSESLYKRLFSKGADLLFKILQEYLDNNLKLEAQNDMESTFTTQLKRDDGYINLKHVPPIEKLQRMIKAYYPWPGVWLRMNDKGLRIKLLPEGKIQVEGKNPVSYKDFLNGYPKIKQELRKLLEQLT